MKTSNLTSGTSVGANEYYLYLADEPTIMPTDRAVLPVPSTSLAYGVFKGGFILTGFPDNLSWLNLYLQDSNILEAKVSVSAQVYVSAQVKAEQ